MLCLFLRLAAADVTVSNRSSAPITGPLVVTITAPTGSARVLRPDGTNALGQGFLDLSPGLTGGMLAAGASTEARLLALEMVLGVRPSVQARVYALGAGAIPALAQTRTVDDSGLPLPSVTVEELGGTGESSVTDAVSGWVTLARSSGQRSWRFSAPGSLPAWRSLSVSNGVQVVPHPRLVRRSGRTFPITRPNATCRCGDGLRHPRRRTDSSECRQRFTGRTGMPPNWEPALD